MKVLLDHILEPTPYAHTFNVSQIALWNLLYALQPKYVLDIGTWEGTTAMIAADYMNREGIDGIVVTLDVVIVNDLCNPKIIQLQVYPYGEHIFDPYPWTRDRDKLLPDWNADFRFAYKKNLYLLQKCMHDRDIPAFDCAYVDGDHSEQGFMNDMHIVERVVRPPHYALLDDVYLPGVGCGVMYDTRIKKTWRHYDFEDACWADYEETRLGVRGYPRMALVWKEGL